MPAIQRIPHGEITATVTDGVMTFVTRDERRKEIPVARLYLYETLGKFGAQKEKEIRMEKDDFPAELQPVCQRIRQAINGLAWKDFQNKLQA